MGVYFPALSLHSDARKYTSVNKSRNLILVARIPADKHHKAYLFSRAGTLYSNQQAHSLNNSVCFSVALKSVPHNMSLFTKVCVSSFVTMLADSKLCNFKTMV